MCVAATGGLSVGQHQHVITQGWQQTPAKRAAVGRRLAVGGGPHPVPPSLAEIVHIAGLADLGYRGGAPGCSSRRGAASRTVSPCPADRNYSSGQRANPSAGCPPGGERASGIPERWCGRPLGLPDELVGEEDEALTNGLGIDEAHGLLVADVAEEALAGPEHDREEDQPQLVDQVMLD
jgi:hypothetical protein